MTSHFMAAVTADLFFPVTGTSDMFLLLNNFIYWIYGAYISEWNYDFWRLQTMKKL